ncbi:MAG: hypothetical protein AAF066_02365 [Pseudomonadota bacterium]
MTYPTLDLNLENIASEIEAETLHIQREYARFGEMIFDPDLPFDPGAMFEHTEDDEAYFESLYQA